MIEITPDDRKAFDAMLEVLAQERQSVQAAHTPDRQDYITAGWANACITEALIIECARLNDLQIIDWLFVCAENAIPKIRRQMNEDRGASPVRTGEAPPMAKPATAVKAKPKPVKLAKKPAAKRRGASKR